DLADYVASVNLSGGRESWAFALKALPRPRGRATRVIITEYALPRLTIAPHDVRPDADGVVWYSNFVEPFLGRLDPKTRTPEEFPHRRRNPKSRQAPLALEPAQAATWCLSMMFQGGLTRFAPRTKEFRHYPIPPEQMTDGTQQSLMMPGRAKVDGKVWTNDV